MDAQTAVSLLRAKFLPLMSAAGGVEAGLCQLWFVLIDRLEERGLLEEGGERAILCAREAMLGTAEVLAATPASEAASRFQQAVIRRGLVELAPREFGGGAPDDPSTPWGFWRALMPLPQPSDRLRIYAPCVFGVLECIFFFHRWLHRICRLLGAAARQLSPSAIEVASARAAALADPVLRAATGQPALLGELIDCVTAIKSAFPYVPLLSPGTFYLEARRFYKQQPAGRNFWVWSTTSGLVVPEEYYGHLYDEPGLTQQEGWAPGSFSELAVPSHEGFLRRLAEVARHDAAALKSPLRPVYFDSALQSSQGGRVHYVLEARRTGQRLRENYRRWSQVSQKVAERYRRDAEAILAWALSHPHVRIYILPGFRDAWASVAKKTRAPVALAGGRWSLPEVLTLHGPAKWYCSVRDPERKHIAHGFIIDFPLMAAYAWRALTMLLAALVGDGEAPAASAVTDPAADRAVTRLVHSTMDRIQAMMEETASRARQVEGTADASDARARAQWIVDGLLRGAFE